MYCRNYTQTTKSRVLCRDVITLFFLEGPIIGGPLYSARNLTITDTLGPEE